MLRRWLPLFAILVLIGAALSAAALAEPQIDVVPLPRPTSTENAAGRGATPRETTAAPAATDDAMSVSVDIPPWVNVVLSAACVLSIVLVAALLLWFVLRDTMRARGRPITTDEGDPAVPAVHAAEVAAALDAGLAELTDMDRDPRRAVIACWVRLEEAATAAGTPRQPSDAPGDYVLRLLSTQAVSRKVLDRFASVYRHARYGASPVDEAMRELAISSLSRLRTELTARVGTAVGESPS